MLTMLLCVSFWLFLIFSSFKRGFGTEINSLFQTKTVPCEESQCAGTVIFLHGSGSTGEEMKELVRTRLGEDLTFPNMQIRYPTAPLQPYTMDNGKEKHVWFDRIVLEQSSPEQLETVNKMGYLLQQLVDEEIQSGIPADIIIIGGFSQGGSMALIEGLRFSTDVAGIFALSSFLNIGTQVYKDLQKNETAEYPELFFAHGDVDVVVLPEWTGVTIANLRQLGLNSTTHVITGMTHDVSKDELLLLKDWIMDIMEDTY